MKKVKTVSIARDFSKYPAGRYRTDGPFPGEACRERLIVPALKDGNNVVVDLNGTLGYGSSFLEEAFGGLVRIEGFSVPDLRARLTFVSDDRALIEEVWSYIDDAGRGRPSPRGHELPGGVHRCLRLGAPVCRYCSSD